MRWHTHGSLCSPESTLSVARKRWRGLRFVVSTMTPLSTWITANAPTCGQRLETLPFPKVPCIRDRHSRLDSLSWSLRASRRCENLVSDHSLGIMSTHSEPTTLNVVFGRPTVLGGCGSACQGVKEEHSMTSFAGNAHENPSSPFGMLPGDCLGSRVSRSLPAVIKRLRR